MNKNKDILDETIYSEEFIIDGFSNNWDRVRHFVIDGSVIIASSMLIYYQLYRQFLMESKESDYPVGFLIFVVIYFFYYQIFEMRTGRTLGKIINKTLVVTEESEKPSAFHVLMRTVLRIPFALINNALLQAPLHDVFSKTRVIRIKKRK